MTQVKLYLETAGRQVSLVNVYFDRLADTHYQMKHILTVWQTCTLGFELTRTILYWPVSALFSKGYAIDYVKTFCC